jgi:hypothetical protein
MRITLVGHRRLPLTILATLAAGSLLAQTALIEQGRGAIRRGDSEAEAEAKQAYEAALKLRIRP